MSKDAQLDLGVQPVSGVGPVSGRSLRGRGATPQRYLLRGSNVPNPAGRKILEFRYRPLKSWSDTGLMLAESAAEYYFRLIGAFRVADDEVMRLCYQAVQDASQIWPDHALKIVLWAIDAKAATLRGKSDRERIAKRRFAGHPRSFFEKGLDHWLSMSPDYQSWLARQREAAARARRAAQRAAEDSAQPPATAEQNREFGRQAALIFRRPAKDASTPEEVEQRKRDLLRRPS